MTEARVDLPIEELGKSIFISSPSDKIKIQCNWCSREGYIFYEGEDTDHNDTDWLGDAVRHMIKYHPKFLQQTT